MTKCLNSALTVATLSLMAAPALSDTITNDLTIRDKLCVGVSCEAGGFETFADEIVLLKSLNTWIKFEDSSVEDGFGNFPGNDWQLKVNDSSSGGQNYFAIEDLDGATLPFRVDAGAPTDTLRVAADGRIGLRTGVPQRDLHIKSGSNLTIRMEQDGSTGGAPQTWDIGANSSNFFLFDDTNGVLPFRVITGTGNGDALVVASDGDIGLGTLNPQAKLHVAGTSMLIKNAGRVNFTLSDTSDPGPDFRTQLTAGTARFSFGGTGAPEMELFQSGDLAIRGRYISAGTTLTVPDYVFDEDYALRPLSEVQSFIDAHSHLPDVPSAADITAEGLDITEMQMTLLKKIEELTLYTLEQQKIMEAQAALIAAQQAQNAAQEARLTALDADMAALKAPRD
ncbi:MAG: hypothetical protein AAF943_18575 [Pseudomonadota bacterium]